MSTAPAIEGGKGRLALHRWSAEEPTFVAVIVHGLGEHARRYDHVAHALVTKGAAVYAGDHHGHGESEGEQGLVDDMDLLVEDTARVVDRARSEHPGLPVVMIGHSLGGLVATRYAQRGDHGLTALVLSGPAVGANPDLLGLVQLPDFPDVPIDPAILSRDPAVGEAYAADPLVYHGPLLKPTLESIISSIEAVKSGGDFGDLPTLWIHGEEDFLAPYRQVKPVVEQVGGTALEQKVYSGARHEIFNETNQDEVIADVLAFLERRLGR